MTGIDASNSTKNSFPTLSVRSIYVACTFLLAVPTPRHSAMISWSGTILRNGMAVSGFSPSGRLAIASTRAKTPIVSCLAHTGHFPLVRALSCGNKRTPQSAWPSKWYFPSSGKNSMVSTSFPFWRSTIASRNAAKVRSGRSKTLASRPRLRNECASEFDRINRLSSSRSRQFIAGSEDKPVSMA